MKFLNNIVKHLSDTTQAPYSTRLFTLLIYCWFVVNAFSLWDIKDIIWGENSIVYRSARPANLLNNFFFQLVYNPERFQVIYWTHLFATLISLFEFKWSFVTRLITWATGMMLYCSAPQAFNSGILIMLLMSLYSTFVYTKSSSEYRKVISNLSRYAMIIQVMMIYLLSSFFKLCGNHWVEGQAVYYALNIDVYSSPFWQGLSKHHLLWTIITYLSFAYQLLFPFLIWFKGKRNWLLIAGVFFHLMIGLVMNLWDFAFAMIFCYALFMKEEQAKWLMPFRTLR